MTETTAEHEAIANEARSAIERALASLTPSDREVWERLGNGESYDDIARATGRTAAAVKQAAYRIRLRIQNSLPEGRRPAGAGGADD